MPTSTPSAAPRASQWRVTSRSYHRFGSVDVDVAVAALGVRGAGLLAVLADELALAAAAGEVEAEALADAVGGCEARLRIGLRVVRELVRFAAAAADGG